MRIDPRHERNVKSVLSLQTLLMEIIENPKKYFENEKIRTALSSQGKLAKLSISERDITASSTNTIKRIADQKIKNGGFLTLDSLRRDAKKAIEECDALKEKEKPKRIVTLQDEVSDLKSRLQMVLQDNWILTSALNKSMSQGRHYAENSGVESLLELCKREQSQLRAMCSLLKNSKTS